MALTQIDFDADEEEFIKKVMEKEHLNKPRAVKFIFQEYIKNVRAKD